MSEFDEDSAVGNAQIPEAVFIDPKAVEHCTPPSAYTDLNQHDANKDHPHAYFNRGYFIEKKRVGLVLGGDWDTPLSPRFDELLEYVAIRDHMAGNRHWSESDFCKRCVRAVESGYYSKGFDSARDFVDGRLRQLEELISSISKHGVHPSNGVYDNISVNIDSSGRYMFNNRGHHRLAIACNLGIKEVPVLVVVTHKKFFSVPERNGRN